MFKRYVVGYSLPESSTTLAYSFLNICFSRPNILERDHYYSLDDVLLIYT